MIVHTGRIMQNVTEKHQVHWVLFPINNDRTAWRSFGLPIILVEPDRRDAFGNPIENSRVQSIRVAIEDVPRKAVVAGHDHVGLLFPDRELYAETLDTAELINRQIDCSSQQFFTANGTEIDYADAKYGDLMQYNSFAGIRDTILYNPTANYYDISDIKIETEELSPDYYYISYQAEYYVRVTSETTKDQLICINNAQLATAVYRFKINHPGQVMEESFRLTPAIYATNFRKSDDTTIGFYRPFTDVLQDIFDEQNLLERLNWVDEVTPEFLPYLAYLIGVDVPFFPRSLDKLRRTMMRNVVRLQQLKGSKRALIDLFELFGYNIYISNLYWSKDGSRLIRPGQVLPVEFEDQQISISSVTQIEPLLSRYNTDGFGQIQVPLLYRPTTSQIIDGVASVVDDSDVVIDAYLVGINTAAHAQLLALMDDINADPSGYGSANDLPIINSAGVNGYSQIVVSGKNSNITSEVTSGITPPFVGSGIVFDRKKNIVNLVFNGAILFSEPNPIEAVKSDGYELFCFATYERQEFIIPSALQDLQSNRFDLQILTRENNQITSDVLEFLIDFLFKIKAFHSLLNVIILRQDLNETYEVTDLCVGGDFDTRYDTDIGRLQVPPAIIPNIPSDASCISDARNLGYKDEDILLRQRKLANLPEEHAAWQALNDRDTGEIGNGNTRITPTVSSDRDNCKFNNQGQDRLVPGVKTQNSDSVYHPGPGASSVSASSQANLDESPIRDTSNGAFLPTGTNASTNKDTLGYGSFTREYTTHQEYFCEEDGISDYCYKGRVEDELLHQEAIGVTDFVFNRHCSLGMGVGVYYTFPTRSVFISYSNPKIYSGGSLGPSLIRHIDSVQKTYLTQEYNKSLPSGSNNYLGRLLRAYDTPTPSTLHYNNRAYFDSSQLDQINYLAIQRPELNIEQPIMHFPGCRFPSMGKLFGDFEHPVWRAKPWDDQYSVPCGPYNSCRKPTLLNAVLIENEAGDLVLSFDDLPFTIIGNGLYEDVSSFSNHEIGTDTLFSADDVVHSVYSRYNDGGHPAITLDCVSSSLSDTITTTNPVFRSARVIGSESLDYTDGYASSSGLVEYVESNISRDGLYADFVDALDIPIEENPSSAQVLFTWISGIRHTTAHRFDCGCLVPSSTDTTTPEQLSLPCTMDSYIDQYGDLDFNPDHIIIEPSVKLEEQIGTHCFRLNGEIKTMFDLLT